MPRLSIRLLGPMQVTLDGERAAFATDKVRALLAYLAVESGKPHRRETLSALLWAGQPDRAARASLRRALADLRRAIADESSAVLHITRQTIGFDPAADASVDVHELVALLGKGATVDQLERGVGLYAGPFLEGFTVSDAPEFDQWALLEREHLQREMSSGIQRLVEQLEAAGEYERGLGHAWHRLELDPWHEGAHRQVMRLLALNGQRSAALAQFDTMTAELALELGVEPEPESRRLYEQIRAGELAAAPAGAPVKRMVGACPYRGLAAFREADAPVFFGRDEFVAHLVDRAARQPITAVVGPSGSGKTSVVFAGLVPLLREDPAWFVVAFRPGGQPFHALAGALLAEVEPEQSESDRLIESRTLASALADGHVPLADVAARVIDRAGADRLLLVVDQAEELYTLCADTELQHRFVDRLLDSVDPVDPLGAAPAATAVLLTLRADFMGHALAQRRLADAFQDAALMLGPMSRDELRAAVEQPAELRGAALEPGLAERLLDDVADEPGALPLVEFALTLLWERAADGWLTHAAYDTIGHVDGALAQYADEVFGRLDDDRQQRARLVFEQLVRPGDGTDDTRRIATRTELSDWPLVQHLADERLVVTGRDAEGRETVEVVHEALIQRWGLLHGWMESHRTFRIWQEGLRAALRAWHESAHDEGALLRGGPLTQAEEWADAHCDALSGDERAFIEAGVEARDRRAAEADRRRRRTVLVLAVGLVVAVVLAGVALNARSDARREADVNRSLVLAADAVEAAERGESDLAVALALEAAAVDDPPGEIQRALSIVAQAPGTRAVLTGHSHPVRAAVVGPDARVAVTGSCAVLDGDECTSGELIVWDLDEGRESRRLDGHTGWVNDVAFLPDGATVLSASGDGSIGVWDLDSAEVVRRLTGHADGVTALAVDPAGELALSGSDDASLILWDLATGEQVRRFEGHRAGVTQVAFGPAGGDGAAPAVYSAANDTTMIRWDPATGEVAQVFEGHRGAVTDLATHPDGEVVYSLSDDLSFREWDVATGAELRQQGFGAGPKSLALAPDGRSALVSVKTDVRHWDIENWQERQRLAGHSSDFNVGAEITAIAIDPTGRFAVTAGFDRTVRVWNLAGHVGQRRFETGGEPMEAVDVVADGSRLVTGTGTGEAVVWDIDDGSVIARMGGEGFSVAPDCVATTPDMTRALVCAGDFTAATDATSLVVYDLETAREVHRFDGHVTTVRAVTVLPDGRSVLSGSQSLPGNEVGDVVLWDLATGDEIRRFDISHDVTSIAVSESGELAITGSATGFVAILWDVATGTEIRRFVGSVPPLNVAFGPEEATVLTASWDGTVIRWDIGTGEVVRRFEGHEADVWGLDISADGRSAISSSADGTVVVWDLASGEERHRLEAHGNYVFDVAFAPDGDTAYSAGLDGLLIEWQGVDKSLDELVAWIETNRYVRDLTCAERDQYRLDTAGCVAG